MQTLASSYMGFGLVSDYVFMQALLINDSYYSWLRLSRKGLFSAGAGITTREEEGDSEKQTKTKVGRARLPGFILHHMRAGLCLEDEWWVIYFAGFLPVLRRRYFETRSSSRLPPPTPPRKMALASLGLWRAVGDLYLLYVTSCMLDS